MQRWLEPLIGAQQLKQSAKLMNEQCWCWGQDVKYAHGNLLLTYGFQRERTPHPQHGSSMYTLVTDPYACFSVWGFGIFYGIPKRGGIFIGRNGFNPLYTPVATINPPVFTTSELPDLSLPNSVETYQQVALLLPQLCALVAQYEIWILTSVGSDYRCQCLAEWRRRPVEKALSASRWDTLATCISRALATGNPPSTLLISTA